MKNESGVTLVSLVVTIILIFILASITTYSGIEAYKDMKKENYVAKLKVIQEKVDLIASEYDSWSGKKDNPNINVYLKECLGIDKEDQTVDGKTTLEDLIEAIGDSKENYYYFSTSDLTNKLGLSGFEDSEMSIAVNFDKRYVIEKQGIKVDGVEYHTQYDLPGGQKINLKSDSDTKISYATDALKVSVKNYGLTAKVVLSCTGEKDEKSINITEFEYRKKANSTDSSTDYAWKKVDEKEDKNYAFTVSEAGSYEVRVKDETTANANKTVSIVLNNPPVLADGMTAKKWNGSSFENVSDLNSGDWYDYSSSSNLWANAVDANGNWWVWIPRFAYSITESNKIGSIKFLKELSKITTENTVLGSTIKVHPAFQQSSDEKYTNGEWDSEISGFWVNKYLISKDASNKCVSVPGKEIIKVTPTENNGTISNVTFANTNSHLSKTSEHGAILYLSYYVLNNTTAINTSKYAGGATNESGIYSTNKAMSSTGNATGIYDLSSKEYGEILAGKTVSSAITNKKNMMYYLTSTKVIGDAINDSQEQVDTGANQKSISNSNYFVIFGKKSGTTQNMFNCEYGNTAGYRGVLITK